MTTTFETDRPPDGDAPDVIGLEQVAADAAPDAPPPPDEPKKKIGRPPGSRTRSRAREREKTQPAAPEVSIPPELVLTAIKAPYAFAAGMYGEHWNLSDAEAEAMVPAHTALAQEYLPGVLKKHASLYTVCFLHLLTIFGKTQIHFRLKAEAAAAAEKEVKTVAARTTDNNPRAVSLKSLVQTGAKPGPKENPLGV